MASKKTLKEALKPFQNPKAGFDIEYVDSTGKIQRGKLMSKPLYKINTREKAEGRDAMLFTLRHGHARRGTIDLSSEGGTGWKWITYRGSMKNPPSLAKLMEEHSEEEEDEEGNLSIICVPGSKEHEFQEASGSDDETDNNLVTFDCLKNKEQVGKVVRQKELVALERALNLYHDEIVFAHRDHGKSFPLSPLTRSYISKDRSQLVSDIERLRSEVEQELDKSQDSREIAQMILDDIARAMDILFDTVRTREQELMINDSPAFTNEDDPVNLNLSVPLGAPRNSTLVSPRRENPLDPEKEKPSKGTIQELEFEGDVSIPAIQPVKPRYTVAGLESMELDASAQLGADPLLNPTHSNLHSQDSMMDSRDPPRITHSNQGAAQPSLNVTPFHHSARTPVRPRSKSFHMRRSDINLNTPSSIQNQSNMHTKTEDAILLDLLHDLEDCRKACGERDSVIHDLRRKCEEMEGEIRGLQARGETLKQDKDDWEQAHNRATLEISEYKKANDSWKVAYNRANLEIQESNHARSNLEEELRTVIEEMRGVEARIISLETDLDDASSRAEVAELQLADARSINQIRIDELQSQVDILQEEQANAQNDRKTSHGSIVEARMEVSRLEKRVIALDEHAAELQEELTDAERAKSELRSKLEERDEEIDFLNEKVLTLEQDEQGIIYLENRVRQLDTDTREARKQFDLKINTFKTAAVESEARARDLQSTLNKELEIKAHNERTIASLRDQIVDSEKNISILKDRIEELLAHGHPSVIARDNAKLQGDVKLTEMRAQETYSKLLHEANAQSASLKATIRSLEEKVENLDDEANTLRRSLSEANEVIRHHEAHNSDPAEGAIKDRRINELERELEVENTRKEALELRVANIQEELNRATLEINLNIREGTRQLDRERSENARLQNKVIQLEDQVAVNQAASDERLRALEQQNSELQRGRSADLQIRSSLNDTIASLSKEKSDLTFIISSKEKELMQKSRELEEVYKSQSSFNSTGNDSSGNQRTGPVLDQSFQTPVSNQDKSVKFKGSPNPSERTLNDTHQSQLDDIKQQLSALRSESIASLAGNSGKNNSLLSEVRQVLYKARTAREHWEELVKTEQEIENLDLETVRRLLSSSGDQDHRKAVDEFREIDNKIETIMINNSEALGNRKLTEEDVEDLVEERELCSIMRTDLKETRTNLHSSALRRNIKLTSVDRRDKGTEDKQQKPHFDGNGATTHVYEFLSLMKDYLNVRSIPIEEAGEVMRSFITGAPRRLIDGRFRNKVNPNYEELCSVLREQYGNRKAIFRQIKIQHEAIGRIPEFNQYLRVSEDNLNQIAEKVEGHMILFEKVRALRSEESRSNGGSGLDISDYRHVILRILPDDEMKIFANQTKHTADDSTIMFFIEDRLEGIRDIVNDFVRESLAGLTKDANTHEPNKPPKQDNKKKGNQAVTFLAQQVQQPPKNNDNKDNGSSSNGANNSKRSYPEITKRNVSIQDCKLCSHLDVLGLPAPTREHGVTQGGKGDVVVIDSCPHILKLNMKDKHEFIKNHGFCRSCMQEAVGPTHNEKKCAEQLNPRLKCRESTCTLRYLICPDHVGLHTQKLKTKRKGLVDAGFNYNFIAFAKTEEEMTDEVAHSMITMPEQREMAKFKSEDDLVQSVCYDAGGKLVEEVEGPPIFIYCHVMNSEGKQALISFDTCSSYTLFSRRAVGGIIPSLYIEMNGREYVSGIGGDQKVENCVAVIPMINGKYYKLRAQVVSTLLNNRYAHLRKEAKLLKMEAANNGTILDSDIDYAEHREEVQALIGIKNSDLMPELVFKTSVGLNIYKTDIYTGKNGNKPTFCMGGCIGLLNRLQRLHGKHVVEDVLSLITVGTFEKIPEIRMTTQEVYEMTYKETSMKSVSTRRIASRQYDSKDEDDASLQKDRVSRDLSWTEDDDKCQHVLSFLAHSHLGHPELMKEMTDHEKDDVWSSLVHGTRSAKCVETEPSRPAVSANDKIDFREDIMSFLAYSYLGHPNPIDLVACQEQDVPLSQLGSKISTDSSESYCLNANIPKDETRFDFVNSVLKSSFKVSNTEIEEMLMGPSAERSYRCARCAGCRDCEKEPRNEAISISKLKEDQKFKDMVRIDDKTNLIICKLPLPENYRNLLSKNKPTAARRLQREYVKLSKLEKSKAQVAKTWKKYRDNGFIKLREEMSDIQRNALDAEENKHFLCCSIAYKIDSISTAARICVDPSSPAGPGGSSLNSILPRGDVVLNLPGNVQRFLSYPHQEIADVKCFYNSFHLDPSQIHVHGFLWDEDLNPNNTPREYFMVVLFFGIICISKLCQISLELVAQRHPRIEDTVMRDMYVDDLGVRGFSKEMTKRLRANVTEDFGIYSLRFKGWGADHEVPDPEVADEGWMSYLGLKWRPEFDVMTIKIPKIFRGCKKKGQTEQLLFWEGNDATDLFKFLDGSMTFRELLGRVMAFFDSSGLLSPLLSSLRNIIREASRVAGREYDLKLPVELTQRFCELAAEFENFRDWEYPRNNHTKPLKEESFDIIAFSDAGSIAKQTVMYTRAQTTSGDYTVSFLGARNALCRPIQNIPKSELDALFMASLHVDAALRNLSPHIVHRVAFTDSMITVHWLLNYNHALQLFHRTRVAQILKTFTSPDGEIQIYWIVSYENIADLGTKGKCRAQDLSPTSAFALGPEFLKSDLKEAEEKGIIMKIKNVKSQLPADENKLMNDGLLIKKSPWLDNVLGMQNTNEDDVHESFHATESGNRLQTLYKHGGYIMNPLKLDFSKVVTVHMLVFKFLKQLIKPCSIHSKSTKFTNILNKWKSNSVKQTAFAFYSHATNPVEQSEFTMEHREISRMLNDNSDNYISEEIIKNTRELVMDIERQMDESPRRSKVPIARLQNVVSQIKDIYFRAEGKGEAKREAMSFMAKGKPTIMDLYSEELRSWKIYPGCNKALTYIMQLKEITSSWGDKVPKESKSTALACALVLNVHRYVHRYVNYEYTKPLMVTLKFHLTEITAHLPEGSWKMFSDFLGKCQETPLEVLRAYEEPALYEAIQWLCFSAITESVDDLTTQSSPTRLEAMKPRNLIAKALRTQAEYAELQLLTYSYFHTIFTREIKATWSQHKIKVHCIDNDGKYISSWRLRTGAEMTDVLVKELKDGMATCDNIYPTWPSTLPVADKLSPLILSMCYHFHYKGSGNPLQRSKLLHHRGIHMNLAQLTQLVVVPGAIETLTKIRDGCALCRVRLNRHYQAIFGSLPPTAHVSNQGFLCVQVDQMGPFKTKTLHSSRETRGHQHAKLYVMAMVCMLTKAVHLELMEDMSAESVASAMSRLSCQQQAPAVVFCDRHKSNIHVMEKAEFHTQVNDILVRQHGFRYELCPVGKHFSHGLVESKIKSVGRLLGKLDMENYPMSIIEFQTFLLMIQELINNIPLGVTLDDKDPCLKVVTPAKLIGKVNGRRIMRPISVPADASRILVENEERWKAMAQVFSSVVLPAMLKNYKWHQDSGEALHEEAVVMFKKKTGYNFVNEWSLGRIVEIYPGADSKVRSAKIEYVAAQDDNDLVEMHGNKADKTVKHTTIRDANEIIMLFPICSGFNMELKQLHYEMLQLESKQIQQDLSARYVKSKNKSFIGVATPASCIHGTQIKHECKVCQLLKDASREVKGTIEISHKDTVWLKGEFRYDPDLNIMQKLANLLRNHSGSSDSSVNHCDLLYFQGQPCVRFRGAQRDQLSLSQLARTLSGLWEKYSETIEPEIPPISTTDDQITVKVMDSKGITLVIPVNIIKKEIDKRRFARRNKKNKKLQEFLQLKSDESIKDDVENLEQGVFRKRIHWEDPAPPRQSEKSKYGGCTSSCCCWQHCSITHFPELLSM